MGLHVETLPVGRWCVVPCRRRAGPGASAGDDALASRGPPDRAGGPLLAAEPDGDRAGHRLGRAAGTDESELLDGDEVAVCSFTEPDHLGLIQVQVDEESGRPEFDRRRADLVSSGMDGRDASIDGASAAFDSPDHGVVGMLVGDTFVQVVTIGSAVDDRHHLDLAAVVAGHLS
jgi:hypothetical protein